MSKIVRKLRPDDYWRIGEHESWFSDMALEGLHLKKIGNRIATFEKGEPKKTRYRIDIYQGEYSDKEQKQFYSENGWEFVNDYDHFNVYSSPVELNAPELHTDPVEQSYTLKTIEDKMRGYFIMAIFTPIILLGLLYLTLFADSTPYLALLDNFTMQALMLTIIGSRGVYDSTRSFLSIRCLRKSLLEGKSIDHDAPWKNRNKKSKIISYTLFAIYIIILIIPLTSIKKRETHTLPVTSPTLPIVRLADVEQNPALIREKPSSDKEIDYGNFYGYDWNIFAPIQYESNESGIVPKESWKDNSGTYTPSIRTKTYKLAIPKMKDGVLNGLIKRSTDNSNSGEFIEISNPDFERLVVHQEENYKEAFAYKGSLVMKVRYFGHVDIDNIIQAMADKIGLISD